MAAGALCLGPALSSGGESSGVAPQAIVGRLPAAIAAKYAIFRRATRHGDRPPGTAGTFARELGTTYQLASYYAASVRSVLMPGVSSRRYLIVPAFARREPLPPANCMSSQQRRELQEQQARRATEPVYCIVEVRGRRIRPASSCTPFAANEEGGEVFSGASTTGRPIIELAPDPVALVRIVAPAGTITARTSENVFRFKPPAPPRTDQAQLQALQRQIAIPNLPKAQRERAINEYNNLLAEVQPKQIEWLNAAERHIRAIPASDVARGPHSVGDLRAPIKG